MYALGVAHVIKMDVAFALTSLCDRYLKTANTWIVVTVLLIAIRTNLKYVSVSFLSLWISGH